MRKFLFILVLFLAAAFIFLGLGELESIVDTLQHGNVWLILLALAIQGGWFLMVGTTYRSLYQLFNLNRSIFRLSLVVAAANFINIVAPSGGMGGVAMFVRDGTRNGQPAGRIIVANVLFFFVDYLAFLGVLAMGLIVLFRRNDLDPGEIAASAFLFLNAAVFGSLIHLGYRNAHRLGDLLAAMARFVNRLARPFIHREYLSEERAHEFAEEIGDGLRSLPHRPVDLGLPLLFAFMGKTFLMAVLLSVFLAFQVPFSAGTIIGGFAIAYLFMIVSPTPAGIGIVEGVMPLALSSLRVPWSQAVVITLAYRGITFWVPFGVGAIAFRVLTRDEA